MAIFEVRNVFRYGDRFWENVWHVDTGVSADFPPALVTAFEVFGLQTLLDIYQMTRVVWRVVGTTDAFSEFAVNGDGHVASGSASPLPLYDVIKLILVGGTGRPGSKLLRGLLLATDLVGDNFTINPTLVSYVNTQAANLFNAVSDASCQVVFGADNGPAVTAVAQAIVQMRQQHRKRRRTP
jgi:hypothetical protein